MGKMPVTRSAKKSTSSRSGRPYTMDVWCVLPNNNKTKTPRQQTSADATLPPLTSGLRTYKKTSWKMVWEWTESRYGSDSSTSLQQAKNRLYPSCERTTHYPPYLVAYGLGLLAFLFPRPLLFDRCPICLRRRRH